MSMMGYDEALDVARMQDEGVRQARHGLIATFYHRPVQNEEETEVQGRPIFDTHDYIEIMIPGDSKTKVNRRVKNEDKEKYPEAWARFQNNEKGAIVGTPLTEWNFLTSTRAAELRAQGLSTVEEIADMADGYLGNLGPDGRKLQDRAKQFLAGSDGLEVELRKEIQARDETIANLSADMESLRRMVSDMQAPKTEPRVDKRTRAYKDSQKED